MKTTIQRLFIALLSATLASAQVVPRDPVTVDRTNRRVGTDIKIPTGKTLTVESGGSLTLASGSGLQINGNLYFDTAGDQFLIATDASVFQIDYDTNTGLRVNSDLTIGVGGKLYPITTDGAALGDTTHQFSDLFLALGAVVNWDNGNAVLTHSSGILTVSTGDLRVTTAGTNSASVATLDGTQTLTNKTISKASNTLTGVAGSGANSDITSLTGVTGTIQLPAGSAATPALNFGNATSDTATGIFSVGANSFGFATNGVVRWSISAAGSFFHNNSEAMSVGSILVNTSGSAGSPAWAQATDSDSGMYRLAADSMGLTAGGTQRLGWNTSGVYIGASGTAISSILSASAALDFASTAAGAVADLTITVTGASTGDVVALGVPPASVTATAAFSAWVSATNTVTVRFSPKATEDPASATFRATVIKH